MKIIADTNVYYDIGKGRIPYDSVQGKPISPTYLNIYELSTSPWVTRDVDLSRSAIQTLFKFQQYQIMVPPFVYISGLGSTCDLSEEEKDAIVSLVRVITRLAAGYYYQDVSVHEANVKKLKGRLKEGADLINEEAAKIRRRIKDKKKHERGRTDEAIHEFLKLCVRATTNNRCAISDDFDFRSVELLVRTLGVFFKRMETSTQRFEANDWADFAMLAYVQPGDKYCTSDRKWKNLIIEAGCSEYLYED